MQTVGGVAKGITKRIINFVFVIWGVITLSFCLQIFTGTDPAEMIVRKVNVFATEEQIQAVREELGLDAPFLERYTDYIKGVLTGDLGTAITNRQPPSLSYEKAGFSIMSCGLSVSLEFACRAFGWR